MMSSMVCPTTCPAASLKKRQNDSLAKVTCRFGSRMSVPTGECSTRPAFSGREPTRGPAPRDSKKRPHPVTSPTVNAAARKAVVIRVVAEGSL